MWGFTFGAELCWEGWQDLVGIISDLPRKHFVRSVPIPIPIPIISFALETFCPFFTNTNPRVSHDAAFSDNCKKHPNYTAGTNQPPADTYLCTFLCFPALQYVMSGKKSLALIKFTHTVSQLD